VFLVVLIKTLITSQIKQFLGIKTLTFTFSFKMLLRISKEGNNLKISNLYSIEKMIIKPLLQTSKSILLVQKY
jgi:hypothetical protein